MDDKSQTHIPRTLYYRDYSSKEKASFFSVRNIRKFELFWTPRDEEWDEHPICTYEAPDTYVLTPIFEAQDRDGRVHALLKLRLTPAFPLAPRPSFDVELLLLPIECEDGELQLSVVDSHWTCDKKYEDHTFVKKELDRLIKIIENQ